MPATAKKRVRDDPQVRRAQILDEAIRIIGERGYYGFAVHDLAQRCGLTTGGLLYHFKTKEELFLAMLDEYFRRTEAALGPLVESLAEQNIRDGSPSRKAVLNVLRAIMAPSPEAPELVRLFAVLQAEALCHSHPGHGYFHRLETRTLDGFAQLVEPFTSQPLSTARQIYAVMNGLEQQWLWSDGTFDLLAEWDRAIAKILPEKPSRERKNG